ncbi:uncharacterized protein LOC129244030 [Anastrepha obliqua]|uniref:uncharacterized protein LOC129244030 n=1 Tax=Anastrepha obliqua TaxID=95512 RepID=UPI002409D952|nr:uncharacterized protein LOC129244030 [Anastrepha obliqua]
MAHKIENEFYFKLISAVREHPCLYEKNHPHYYNRNKRNAAWQEVSAASDRSGSDCKARWKLLRERFCKQMKRTGGYFSMSTDPTDTHEWEYYNEMLFLKESIIPRRSYKDKDIISSLDEPTINEVFINANTITEDETCSSNSNLSKCTKPSVESHKTTTFDLAPLKIERITDVNLRHYHNSEKPESKTATVKCNTPVGGETDISIEELFVKNIANLIRDLPIEVKDRFQADMYTEVFRLRAQYRNF